MATMDFSKLLSQIESVQSTKKVYENNDNEFWRPTKDSAGNGSAVIHFLPNKNVDEFPFVRIWSHSFKNPDNGRWYIENSLSTLGQKDYISEVNYELWQSKDEDKKKIASDHKRKLTYISNIYVEKDPGNPENNGKVFKYKYGKKIFDKIVAAAKPEEDMGEEPINAYDPLGGASFMLKMTKVSGFPNYDGSRFGSPKQMFGGDEAKIKEVLDACYVLEDEIAPGKFKTQEELKKKYLWVMDQQEKVAQDKEVNDEIDALTELAKKVDKPVEKKKTAPPLPVLTAADDDDDNFFQSLIDD